MMGRGHGQGHGKDKQAGGGCCGGGKDKHDEASTVDSTGDEQPKWVQPEEDRDPVCGKMVSKDVAKTS
ncbi:MAG TPA: hypothetical protein ENI79_02060, partial [Rhodospirillales bacterium]|nr:hypothetical protein [Rhodospirillales bacterium]